MEQPEEVKILANGAGDAGGMAGKGAGAGAVEAAAAAAALGVKSAEAPAMAAGIAHPAARANAAAAPAASSAAIDLLACLSETADATLCRAPPVVAEGEFAVPEAKKKRLSGRGSAAAAAGTGAAAAAAAETLVLDYMVQQNRPYSMQNIFDNLRKAVPKPQLQEILNRLSEEGAVVGGTGGAVELAATPATGAPGAGAYSAEAETGDGAASREVPEVQPPVLAEEPPPPAAALAAAALAAAQPPAAAPPPPAPPSAPPLLCKTYGKFKVYMVSQDYRNRAPGWPPPPPESGAIFPPPNGAAAGGGVPSETALRRELAELSARLTAVAGAGGAGGAERFAALPAAAREALRARLAAAVAAQEAEIAAAAAAATAATAAAATAAAAEAADEAAHEALARECAQARREWAERKRKCVEVASLLAARLEITVNELFETVGVDTDEDWAITDAPTVVV